MAEDKGLFVALHFVSFRLNDQTDEALDNDDAALWRPNTLHGRAHSFSI
jgi:hypothetical protein